MRNAVARHVKTNIKNQVRQSIIEAECCYFCKQRGILYGHYSDAVYCATRERHVRHVQVCVKFERRE